MTMLRKNEYDLMQIKQIGFDPNTGKLYDQCQREWDEKCKRVEVEWRALPWWKFWRNLYLRWQIMDLLSRRGY